VYPRSRAIRASFTGMWLILILVYIDSSLRCLTSFFCLFLDHLISRLFLVSDVILIHIFLPHVSLHFSFQYIRSHAEDWLMRLPDTLVHQFQIEWRRAGSMRGFSDFDVTYYYIRDNGLNSIPIQVSA
jgi:hypothetical protein